MADDAALIERGWPAGAGPPVDPELLHRRFVERTARIAVIGLGYVGLPLVEAAANAGFTVLGVDVDDHKVQQLEAGQSYIKHIASESITRLRRSGRLAATTDFARLAEVDAILICVPTPLTRHREPDLTFIVQTAEAIAPHLTAGQLVVLESTTYPGTTEEVLKPILERRGLRAGTDFFLAYSPEREDPGNAEFTTTSIPKVLGADDPATLRLASALYRGIGVATVAVSSLAVAEAVKLTENIFRAVNIALVNELKVVFDAMGIDIWEVIEAAESKPFGFMPFYPGPGLGGHCIPIDPFYLSWKAREHGVTTRFIELAGEINTAMPQYVVDRLARALDERFAKGLNGARILIMGVAYKKNVDDLRESPALTIMEILARRGASVAYHDPFVPVIPPTRRHGAVAGQQSVALERAVVQGFDAVLVVTDHEGIDYAALVAAAKLVVDTRNATRGVSEGRDRIVNA